MHFTTYSMMALLSVAGAHTTMFSVWVNGKDQGDGRSKYIRSPPNNNPVKDLTSPNVACNVNGGKAGADFVPAAAGDTLTFEWYHNTRGDDIIASSHKGPIITYITAFTESDGSDADWTKIAEDGLDGKDWAVDKLIAAKGKWDVKLPASLKAGKYLVRQEVIGLHEADVAYSKNPARGAQFYPSCVQVEVSGSGTVEPNQKFQFKTGYTEETPGIVYDIYSDKSAVSPDVGAEATYSIPGPGLWSEAVPGSGGNGTSARRFVIRGRSVRV
ncbi:hypothetical protein GQ53DRAFT_878088 [Thozetella sp. PMI_491]|nr:hypothetical protein GQ53DRAFT_878088 [Thozetella sp. PMI_491]